MKGSGTLGAAFADRVRTEMSKQKTSSQALAQRSHCAEKTIDSILAGRAKLDRTAAKVAELLSINIYDFVIETPRRSHDSDVSEEKYGAYARSGCTDLVGKYTSFRRSFANDARLMRSFFEIKWDDENTRLSFYEPQIFGDAQVEHQGPVYLSRSTGLIHFLTVFQGSIRLVTLTRFRLGDDIKLRGVVLTQSSRDIYYQIAVSPIFLMKLDEQVRFADVQKSIGFILPDDDDYFDANREINSIEENTAFFAGARDFLVKSS